MTNHSTLIFALAWGGFAVLVCGMMVPLEPNLVEEGLILHVAERMMRGERLYRDVVSFTGPLPFETLAALFRVFGAEISVARAVVLILQGLSCASIFGVARLAGAGPMAHVAAACIAVTPILLFPLHSIYFHTTLSYQLCLIAAYPAAKGVRSLGWALLAGIVVALAALCKQTIGAALALGLLVAVAAGAPVGRRQRQALAVIAGGLAIAIPTVSFYAIRGDLGVLWESLVTLPASFDDSFSSPFINLWPIGEFSEVLFTIKHLYLPSLFTVDHGLFDDIPRWLIASTQSLYALPFLALAATILRRLRGPVRPGFWVHTVLLIALISNLYPRTDWGHLVFVLPIALAQFAIVIPVASGVASRRIAAVLILGLFAAAAAAHGLLYDIAKPASLGPRVPQRAVTSQTRSKEMARIVAYLRGHTRPGEEIFVARAEPLLYFATSTRNPTPYSGVIPGMRAEQQRTILKGIDRVRYVVMSDVDQPLYTYYRDELPAVQHYLERYFALRKVRRKPSWMSLLERAGDRGETAIDFFDRVTEGKAWILDEDGNRQQAPRTNPKLATKLNRRPLATVLGPGGGGIDFEVDLPEDSRLQVSVGLAALMGADDLYEHGEDTRLDILVSRDGESFYPMASVRVLVGEEGGHWWYPIDVSLSAFGGERVTVRFAATSNDTSGEERWVFWGSPRIALPPPPGTKRWGLTPFRITGGRSAK